MANKFKVGDIVVVKDCYVKEFIGESARVVSIKKFDIEETFDIIRIGIEFENKIGFHDCNGKAKKGHGYWVLPSDIELKTLEKPIEIYQKGSEVIALDKCTGKKSVEKCHPDDEFDFKIGAELAFGRLFGDYSKEPKEKREFKVGDRVKIREWGDMEKEFILDEFGDIVIIPFYFSSCMKHLCGRTATITKKEGDKLFLDFDDKSGDINWSYCTDMLKHTDIPKPKKKVLTIEGGRGIIGTETKLKDINGEELFVGDVVELFDKELKSRGMHFICSDNGNDFVMGILFDSSTSSHYGSIIDGWRIIKRKSFKELKVGDGFDGIKVVEIEV